MSKTTFIAAGDAFITRRLPEGGYEGFEELQELIDEQKADQKENEGKMNVIFNVPNLQPPLNPLAVLHTNPPKIPRSICCQKNSYVQATPRSTRSCAPVTKSCPIVQTSQVCRPRTAIPVVRL